MTTSDFILTIESHRYVCSILSLAINVSSRKYCPMKNSFYHPYISAFTQGKRYIKAL